MKDKLDPQAAMKRLAGQLLKATDLYEASADADGECPGAGQNKRNGAIYAIASVLQALDGMGYSDRHKKALQGLLGALDDVNFGQRPEMFKSGITSGGATRRQPNLVLARHTSAAALFLLYKGKGMAETEAASKVSPC